MFYITNINWCIIFVFFVNFEMEAVVDHILKGMGSLRFVRSRDLTTSSFNNLVKIKFSFSFSVDPNPKVSGLANKLKLLNKKPEENRLMAKRKLAQEVPMQVDDLQQVLFTEMSSFWWLLIWSISFFTLKSILESTNTIEFSKTIEDLGLGMFWMKSEFFVFTIFGFRRFNRNLCLLCKSD